MADQRLTLRDLNRATLARQHLLERVELPVHALLEQLVGLQAQQPISPYITLWTRLPNFQRADLAALIENHSVVKATLMRGTLHLFTAQDYLRLRGTLQAALDAAQKSIAQRRDGALDNDQILRLAQDYLAQAPRTFAEITDHFSQLLPHNDIGAVRYTIRTQLPLIQVPISEGWSYPGNPKFTLAEQWLGQPIPTETNLRLLIFRYLAAFGPASIADMQIWSGIGKLKEAFEGLRDELVTYRDENKRELFDLPNLPLPPGDTPTPVRLIAEFDNLLLSHDKRTRIIADEYRPKLFLKNLRVRPTFLVDGFVRGAWKMERKKKVASLTFELFEPVPSNDRQALAEEAERLLRFAEPDATIFEVQFVTE